MTDYVKTIVHLCVCGHTSGEHDPWPECELCGCVEYEGRIPESKRGLR